MSAGLALSAAVAAANPATFRVISQLGKYSQPTGIAEGAPGLLYFIGGADIVCITIQGSIVPLTGFQNPPYVVKSPPVSGPNRRIYSSVETNGGANTAYSFSVAAIPGYHAYGIQAFSQAFTQNLPDGALLTLAYRFSDASIYLAKTDPDGNVMPPIYGFPSGERQGTYDNAVYATDGNYYGSSISADKSATYVYRITPSGSLAKLLSLPDPVAAYLLQAGDGNLYGATGVNTPSQTGTIFKLTLSGDYTLLHAFPAGVAGTGARLIEGSDGKLYGAVSGTGGGSYLFSVTTSGEYTVLYKMRSADGQCPCTLVQGSDGIVYGTALAFGTTGGGTIFALDAGLPKPAPRAQHFSPASGTVGTKVLIWGQNLLSASVGFNGAAAKGVYSSGPNYVWASVPRGAGTGPISITTQGGTATTRASFRFKVE
jgi:uncharacterized repeat protein (TIGR03803 family)